MTSLGSANEIVEVARYRFRAHVDLKPFLRDVRFEARPGGEYQIRPEDYLRAIQLLNRDKRLQVQTAKDVLDGLGWLTYAEVRSGLRWITVPNPENWTYLSPIARRWRRCLSNETRILVRSGWTLAFHAPRGRTQYYYLEGDKTLAECKQKGGQAIKRGYEGVLGYLPVPFWKSDKFLFAMWPGYVIPKEHERFLTHTLSRFDEPLPTEEGDVIWSWYPDDLELLKDTFRGLRLRFTPWDPEEDWLYTASLIMKRTYSAFLKRRDGAQEFCSIIRQRAWDQIDDKQLRETIKQLCQAEWEGSNAATALLYFIETQLCVDLDWQHYGEQLEGWVLESSSLFYGHHLLEARYYRLVVPRFETVLGWETKRQPDWEGDNRPKVNIYHWRAAPVIGRLKTASVGKEPEPGVASRSFRDAACRSLLALPRVEWDLAVKLAVGAFVLDLDGAHWRGCNDLCRYFAGYGRLIARNPSECDGYGLLLEDATGQRFALETHILRPEDLEPIQAGEWARFIALSSLLNHRAWKQLDREIPVFELKMRQMFQRARESDALRFSLLAAVKYHFGIEYQLLVEMFAGKLSRDAIDVQLGELLTDGDVVKYKGKLYYRYTLLSKDKMLEFLDGNRNQETDAYKLLRPLIHPLFMRSVHLMQEAELVPSGQARGLRAVGVSGSIRDAELQKDILDELKRRGAVRLGARGRQVQRTVGMVQQLVMQLPDLRVRRSDGTHTFDDDVTVDKVEFLLRDPMAQLRIKYG